MPRTSCISRKATWPQTPAGLRSLENGEPEILETEDQAETPVVGPADVRPVSGRADGVLMIELNEPGRDGRNRLIRLSPVRDRPPLDVIAARLKADPETARRERARLARDRVARRIRRKEGT